jgi:hypothetical protein
MIKRKQSIKNRDQFAVETTEAFSSIITQKINISASISQENPQVMQINTLHDEEIKEIKEVLRIEISETTTRNEVVVISMTKKKE